MRRWRPSTVHRLRMFHECTNAERRPELTNVRVRVLVDGVYGYMDGVKMRARPALAGEVIEVAGGRYAEELAAGGLVCAQTDADLQQPAALEDVTPKATGKRSRSGAAA